MLGSPPVPASDVELAQGKLVQFAAGCVNSRTMAELKTRPTGADVDAFLNAVTPDKRQDEARQLDQLFRASAGFAPQMWGENIVGYGRYRYRYASGHKGEFLATGFSPRVRALSVYILPGYADYSSILVRLGRHKTGKSCLYINKLADVDIDVLGELIQAGLHDLDKLWPVQAT